MCGCNAIVGYMKTCARTYSCQMETMEVPRSQVEQSQLAAPAATSHDLLTPAGIHPSSVYEWMLLVAVVPCKKLGS